MPSGAEGLAGQGSAPWPDLAACPPCFLPLILSPPSQVVFSLASGNIAGAFEIVTTNDSIGELFVASPLDREELDHYILKVSTGPLGGGGRPEEYVAHQRTLVLTLPPCHQMLWGRPRTCMKLTWEKVSWEEALEPEEEAAEVPAPLGEPGDKAWRSPDCSANAVVYSV